MAAVCRLPTQPLLLLLVAIILNSQICSCFQISRYISRSRLQLSKGDNPEWWKRNDEEEVVVKVVEDAVLPSGYSLFDDAYTIKNLDGTITMLSQSIKFKDCYCSFFDVILTLSYTVTRTSFLPA